MPERSSRKARAALPPWTGDDAALKAWTIAELNRADDNAHRAFVEGAVNWLRHYGPRRTETESRKRALTIDRRAAAKHREQREQRAVADGDIEALRALHPRLAAFINPINPIKPKRKRPFDDHDWQVLSPEDCLDEARNDVPRIRGLWKEKFGRQNRPRGSLTAEQIAAERWGLEERDVRKQRVHAATRERLARQR
jgi:hypothetical protein